MNKEERFEMCFKGLINDEIPEDSEHFELQQMPYKLIFKDISGYYEPCYYCG